MEKKKSKLGLIIFIVIIILLLLFAVWYFCLRDDKDTKKTNDNKKNNTQEETKKKDKKKEDKSDDKKVIEYDYTDGVLTEIVDEEGNPVQTDFVIDGIILVGNRHSYAGLEAGADSVIAKLVEQGYKTEDINSSFFLNEWIEFYIDSAYEGEDVKILAVPHKTVDEYLKLSYDELEELALDNGGFVIDYQTPDKENNKYVGNGYINMDYPEGKYDILFTYKGKVVYFIELSLTKEEE